MNKILSTFARSWLKAHLAKCTEAQRGTFIAMYGHWMGTAVSIEKVVDQMAVEKIDNAMKQVERTLIDAGILQKEQAANTASQLAHRSIETNNEDRSLNGGW